MAIFISYSSQDRSSLEALTTALKRAQQQVWFDQELGGGDAWWNAILEQIRSCDVFIVALSNNWLLSKPSLAELRYAQALNRPILPVRVGPVDSMRVNPVATLQIIDYTNPTVDAGIQLVTAIHGLAAKAQPLPSPLPEEPPVPFGYITRLGNTLAEKELSPQQQLQLLVELRSGLDEDGDDPSARGDIAQLLRMLRLRHDVTYRTRSEIDNVLAEIEAKDKPAAKPAAPAAKAAPPTQPSAAPRPPASQPTPAAPAGSQSNKRLLIIGGAALAVVVAIVLIVVFATQGGGGGAKKPAAKPGTATSSAGAGGGTTARLEPVLLGVQEISSILDDPNMVASGHGDQLRPAQGTSSIPDCTGFFEPLEESVYKPHGATESRFDIFKTKDSETGSRVVEAAAAFPTADKARQFVEASAAKWRACANQTVKFTSSGKAAEWNVGELTGAAPKITMVRTLADGSGRTCQHVLSAVEDVVIDVAACGPQSSDGAARIADQMGTKAKR